MTKTFRPVMVAVLGRALEWVRELQERFDATSGHTHAGQAGEGPTLANAALNVTWADWTPTITQGAGVTFTGSARQCTLGKVVTVNAILTASSAGTAANAIVIGGLPANVAAGWVSSYNAIGKVVILDTGTDHIEGSVVPLAADGLRFMIHGSTNVLGINPARTLAIGDVIGFTATYETAS